MTLKPSSLSPKRNITSSDYYGHATHLKEKQKTKQKQQQKFPTNLCRIYTSVL